MYENYEICVKRPTQYSHNGLLFENLIRTESCIGKDSSRSN